MKKVSSIILFLFLLSLLFPTGCGRKGKSRTPSGGGTPPSSAFSRSWGTSGFDYIQGIAIGSDGSIYCAGYLGSGLTKFEGLLLKYTSDGTLVWAKSFGDTNRNDVRFWAIAVDSSNNIYCAGYWAFLNASSDDDALLVSFDSNGNLRWAKTWDAALSNSWERFDSVTVDSSDNIYCAGQVEQMASNTRDGLLVKFSSNNGNLLWAKVWNGSGNDSFEVVRFSGGYIYAAGYTNNGVNDDALLVKYDPSGSIGWSKSYAISAYNYDEGWDAVTVDSLGNIYCVGNIISTKNLLLAKCSSDGSMQWAKVWTSSGDDWVNGMERDSKGNIYCVGYTALFASSTGNDGFLIALDSNGTISRSYAWRGNLHDYLEGVAVSANDDVYSAGYSSSSTGSWQPITVGSATSTSVAVSTPSVTGSSISGTLSSQSGVLGNPSGTGTGEYDALLMRNW
ncbi:MAG: hypothetical protein N2234_01510 [Planctomycetota bacterium]|nr:hypothetical protein [Planctomycetota bacterium]